MTGRLPAGADERSVLVAGQAALEELRHGAHRLEAALLRQLTELRPLGDLSLVRHELAEFMGHSVRKIPSPAFMNPTLSWRTGFSREWAFALDGRRSLEFLERRMGNLPFGEAALQFSELKDDGRAKAGSVEGKVLAVLSHSIRARIAARASMELIVAASRRSRGAPDHESGDPWLDEHIEIIEEPARILARLEVPDLDLFEVELGR